MTAITSRSSSSSPLQHYFAQLQREQSQSDLVLVNDSARILPKSKSFTVSSSLNDVRGMFKKTNSEHEGTSQRERRQSSERKSMPSLLSRASHLAAAKNSKGTDDDAFQQLDHGNTRGLRNSIWSPRSDKNTYTKDSSLKLVLCKQSALGVILGEEGDDDGNVDEFTHLRCPTTPSAQIPSKGSIPRFPPTKEPTAAVSSTSMILHEDDENIQSPPPPPTPCQGAPTMTATKSAQSVHCWEMKRPKDPIIQSKTQELSSSSVELLPTKTLQSCAMGQTHLVCNSSMNSGDALAKKKLQSLTAAQRHFVCNHQSMVLFSKEWWHSLEEVLETTSSSDDDEEDEDDVQSMTAEDTTATVVRLGQ